MYIYVSKKEYNAYRLEIETIIKKAQKIMKERFNTTFQFKLIGSGSRHLVTKIKGGNRGYDFDFNLILQKSDLLHNPKKLKEQFMIAITEAIKDTKYSFPEDSTSAITIKVVDKKNSKIITSCDFAIIYYLEDDIDKGYKYLKNWKDGRYSFEFREMSKKIEYKLNEILKYEDGWKDIREEYLKVKNNNKDTNKKSFVLYLESINNVYNQIKHNEGYWQNACLNNNSALYSSINTSWKKY